MENEQKYLSPKLDAVFQELFGRQEREELTKDFLENENVRQRYTRR